MIRFFKRGGPRLLLMIFIGVCLGGCVNNEPNHDSLFNGNRPPIANAGPDQAVASGALVHLNGSGSDPDGDEIRYEWRIISTPRGSNARLDTPASAATNFVADTDGVYHIQLQVIENEDRNLPAGAPIADSGLASDPDEVVVIAGPPGPFENSGNKLILDGSHSALTATLMDLRQASDFTAEGWFWIKDAPPAGKEALVMGKKDFFEIVVRPDSTVLFRTYLLGGGTKEVGPIPFTLRQWHHLAAVVDQNQTHRAYFVLDGNTIVGVDFTGGLNENSNRFTIGGGEGREYLVGMADEVRVTQDVRYPEAPFDPPKDLLIPDSPFVSGARFAVHGLWHFDEFVGSQIFTDFSLRRNDLFLVGSTGFQPFGRLLVPRQYHTAVKLQDESIWIAGGKDDAGIPIEQSERISSAGLISADTNISVDRTLHAKGEGIGTGNGTTTVFTFVLNGRVVPSTIKISSKVASGDVTATDTRNSPPNDDAGTLSGTGVTAGAINYLTGEGSITFAAAPLKDQSVLADYDYLKTSGVLHHTATVFQSGRVLVAGGEDADQKPRDSAFVYTPGTGGANGTITLHNLLTPRRFHTSTLLGNGTIFIVGGEAVTNGTAKTLASTEVIAENVDPQNPDALGFSPGPTLSIPRKLHRDALCNPTSPTQLPVSVGGYDDLDQPSRGAPAMTVGRVRHAVVCLSDGKFLVTGGIDPLGNVLDSAEIYDPQRGGSYTQLPVPMTVPRADHTATLLPNGKVLITGGFNQSSAALSSAEIYDPDLNIFTPLSVTMGLARYGHIALPWKNSVLMIGGADADAHPVGMIEIYIP